MSDITKAVTLSNGVTYPAVVLLHGGKGRLTVLCAGKTGTAIRSSRGYTLTMDDGTFVVRNTTKAGLRAFTPMKVWQSLNPLKTRPVVDFPANLNMKAV